MEPIKTLLGENPDRIPGNVQGLEPGEVMPGVRWKMRKLVVRQVQVSEGEHPLGGREVRQVVKAVGADVEGGEAGQRQHRQRLNVHVRELEGPQSLDVVEELLKVGSNGVGRQVKGHEVAQADEDVVGEDGEAVVGQTKADEVRRVGEHGAVDVLDAVVAQVQVADGGGGLGEGGGGHGYEVVVREVHGLDCRGLEYISGKGAELVMRQIHDAKA